MGRTFEQKIIEQEKKIGLLDRQLVDAIWVLDLETMKFTYISESAERLRGFTAEEAMAVSIKDGLVPDSYDRILEVLLQALDEFERGADPKKTLEVEMYHKNGSTVWLEVTARLSKDDDGRVKAVGTSKDISVRKKHELERESLIRAIGESLGRTKTAS